MAAEGLGKIRLAKILAIVVTVCSFVGAAAVLVLAGAAMSGSGGAALGAAGIGGLMLLVAGILSIVSFVIELLGLSKATGAHPGYKNAMTLVLVNILLAVANVFLSKIAVINTIVTLANPILNFLVVYFVINATIELLKSRGDSATCAKGDSVRTIYMVCMVVNLVMQFTSIIPALAGLALVALSLSSLASLVAFFLYIGFLGASVRTLAA